MDSSDDPQAQKYITESKCLVSMVLLFPITKVIVKVLTCSISLKLCVFIKILPYLTHLQFPLQVIEKNGKLQYEIDTGEETKFVNPEDVARLIFSKMKGIEPKRKYFKS